MNTFIFFLLVIMNYLLLSNKSQVPHHRSYFQTSTQNSENVKTERWVSIKSHFTTDKSETQRTLVTWPRPHSFLIILFFFFFLLILVMAMGEGQSPGLPAISLRMFLSLLRKTKILFLPHTHLLPPIPYLTSLPIRLS